MTVTVFDRPSPGQDKTNRKALFDADVELYKERGKAQLARTQKEVEAELGLYAEFQKGLMEAARTSIDRSRAGAETVQKASAAILGLYTAVLGVSFSVADHPLPSRGVIPAIFLGLAVVCSTAYLAYLTRPGRVGRPALRTSFREAIMARTNTFIEWTGQAARRRSYWLQASVVALGVALAFLPAPFLGALPGVDRFPWNDDAQTQGSTAAARGAPIQPPLPKPASVPVGSPALRKIYYEAQIGEALEARKASHKALVAAGAKKSYADQSWWLAALIGLVAVFSLPFAIRLAAD